MIKTRDATCLIAQIVGFRFDDSARSQGACMVGVEPLGRVNDILRLYPGDDIVKDEVFSCLCLWRATPDVNAMISDTCSWFETQKSLKSVLVTSSGDAGS
jgi:hypothetical protein